MENMVAFRASAFWPHTSPARAHSGAAFWFVGTAALRPISSHEAIQGQHCGISLLVPHGTAAVSLAADKVGPGFRPEIVSAAARGKPGALLAPPAGG